MTRDSVVTRPPIDARKLGRQVGTIMLVLFAAAPVANFGLLKGAIGNGTEFLQLAATHSTALRAAVLLLIAASAGQLAIIVIAFPLFHGLARRLAIALLVLSGVGLAGQLLEGATLLTMLSLSQQLARDGASAEPLVAIAPVLRSARSWVHYSNILLGCGGLFVHYALLLRTALVPSVLASAGLIATALMCVGVALPNFLGYTPMLAMVLPLALVQVAMMGTLIARGYAQPQPAAG